MKKSFLLVILILSVCLNVSAQWQRINTSFPPTNSKIEKIFFIDDTTGYCGLLDEIFGMLSIHKTIDGGVTWNKLTLEKPAGILHYLNIQFVSLNVGHVCLGKELYRTLDAGLTWSKVSPEGYWGVDLTNPNKIDVHNVHFLSKDTGFIMSPDGESGVWKTVNGGLDWKLIISYSNNGGAVFTFNSLSFPTNVIGYALFDGKKLLKSVDGGETWNMIYNPTSIDLGNAHFINNDTGFISVLTGYLLKTNDGGLTWSNVNTIPSQHFLNNVYFPSEKLGFCGDYVTIDGGLTWTNISNASTKSMTFPNDKIGYGLRNVWNDDYSGTLEDRLVKYITEPCKLAMTAQPQNITTALGGSVQFVVGGNDANATYQWQTNIPEFGWLNYPNTTGSILNISQISLQNHGQQFRVIASSSYCRDTSDVATLSITDTCTFTNYVTVTDTLIYNDTLTYNDTTYLTITDTTYLTVTDTTYLTIYDTTYVSVQDTLIIRAAHVGINAPGNVNTIKVYPNPASIQLNIDFGNYSSMNGYALRIDNNIGQTVFNQQIDRQQVQIDLSSWPGKGVYFLRITDPQNNIIEVKKILLQ